MKHFVIIFFLFPVYIFAQNGIVKFMIEQENGYYEVLINDTLLLKTYKDTLPVGKYRAQIWSHGYEVVDTSFIIKENIETLHFQKLKRSGEYYDIMKQERIRNKKKSLLVRTPTYIGVGSCVLSTFYATRLNKLNKEIDIFIRDYDKIWSIGGIQNFKEELKIKEDQYNLVRRRFYTSLGFGLFSASAAIFGNYILNKKYPSQRYKIGISNSPFLNQIGFNFSLNYVSLTYKI